MDNKRNRTDRSRLHRLESCPCWDAILADISGPFKSDSQGHRYCLMMIESLSSYAILISLKSISAVAVAMALYTHVFTEHGVCDTILLTDRGSAFRSALVKAIAETFKMKQIFGMTARRTSLSHVEQVNKLLYNYLQSVCKNEQDWSSHLATI